MKRAAIFIAIFAVVDFALWSFCAFVAWNSHWLADPGSWDAPSRVAFLVTFGGLPAIFAWLGALELS